METCGLSNEQLIDEVLTWGARVARGEALHLQLIAELDEREAWAGHGVTSCAHWLSWKLGWSRTTANERVRVAGALRSLPLMSEAFGQGRLSYSQVRAITRVATADDEQRWLDLGRCCTGAQLDEAARGAERAQAADKDPRERSARQAVRVAWDEDGDLQLTLRIPAHQAVVVLEALKAHQAAEQSERDATLRALVNEVHDASASAEAAPTEPTAALSVPAPRTPAEAATDLEPAVPCPGEVASASAEARPGVDLTSVPEAFYLDPLEHFPYLEPAYPIRPDRFGSALTTAEQGAIATWEVARDRARAVRDAWNDRRERLLAETATHRVEVGRATLADALVRLVTNADGCAPVTVQLLTDPLSGWARTQYDELLPPRTLQQLVEAFQTRWGSRGPVPLELSCYDQGRRTRLVTPAQRRLLGQLDGERCRFPGCCTTTNLHAHHVLFWRHGGATDLDNLVLQCGKHHRLLHDNGYELTLHADRALTVRCPDGSVLSHQPELPTASAEALPPATPETLPPNYQGDRFDLGYIVNVMLAHAA